MCVSIAKAAWMLTGDKLETAWVIAQNSSLVARRQLMYQVQQGMYIW